MKYRKFGSLDWEASVLGFGAMRLPVLANNASRVDETEAIRMIREVYRRLAPVPCTNCKYCMPCPNGVGIADILKYYNEAIICDNPRAPRFLYHNLAKEKQADNCVECFECEEKCPQGIPISEQLKKTHAWLTEKN